jgi:hypothetical protein
MPFYDAVLILGGGVREGGELPPWAQRRYDLALELQSGEPLVCLSAGTTHRPPPLDEAGFPVFESVAGAQYLGSRGIPPDRLYIEAASWDTIGNAYFSKLLFVDPAGWRKLLVVTSEFHMPRSRAVFQWVYGMDATRSYDLQFAEASDAGLDAGIIAARAAKETASLDTFERVASGIATLSELHRWIFTEHKAYAIGGRLPEDRSTDSRVLTSY